MIYNLKYKKLNQAHKVLLEKEGEIVLNEGNFRLKGKGAGDVGEEINFSDIKDWRVKDEIVVFKTVTKDKYILSGFGNLFKDFLRDFAKIRNDFLIKALFMADGEEVAEYEADYEIFSKYEKSLSKGHATIKMFENSIVIMPDYRDAFSISLNFLKRVDVDEEFYEIHMLLDQGFIIHFKRLGNIFEEFRNKIYEVQQNIYQRTVDDFKNILLEFDSSTLIKLAYLMKRGKAINTKELKKIDEKILKNIKTIVLHDDLARKHFDYFSKMADDNEIYFGISPEPPKHQPKDQLANYSTWYFVGIPDKNLVVAEITNGGYRSAYFFKIIMEKGDPKEKIQEKLLEINQAFLKLKFVTTPFYKDKRELRRSIYRFVLRKLPYLRLLRRSYIGRITPFNEFEWDKRINNIFERAKI